MQKKIELVGGPYDGEKIDLEEDPVPTLISAGKDCIFQYSLCEKYNASKVEFYYNYIGKILIGDKKI